MPADVFQKHGPLFFYLLRDGGVCGGVDAGDLRRMLIHAHGEHRAKDSVHHVVEHRSLHVAVLDRQLNAFIFHAFKIASRRLFLVESGCGGLYRAMGPVPVGHNKALESPIVFQNVGQQVRVLARVGSADEVVGAHHRLHAGIFHADFEGQEIAFARAAFVDLNIGGEARGLLIVHGKVLDSGDNVLVLDRLKVLRLDFAGEQRIFARGFEGASAARLAADQINVAAKVHVHPERFRFGADHLSVLVGFAQIPTGCARDRRWECCCLSNTVSDANASVRKIKVRNV